MNLLSLSLSLQATFNNMIPLAELLKTKNLTGNTGNTGNSENAELEPVKFLYSENRKIQEIQKPEINTLPSCGQKSFDELSNQEPQGEEKRMGEGKTIADSKQTSPCSLNAVTSSNQGLDSFETCFQKCLTEIAGRFDKLPWLVRFERTPGGIRSKGLFEILGPEAYTEETEIQAEINRLWSLGLTQDEGAAALTYQEFRAAVIKWYRLWIAAIDRHKIGGA